MAIDPNIILGAVSPSQDNTLQGLQQGLNLVNVLDERRARRAERKRQETLQDVFSTAQFDPETGALQQPGELLSSLAEKGLGSKVLDISGELQARELARQQLAQRQQEFDIKAEEEEDAKSKRIAELDKLAQETEQKELDAAKSRVSLAASIGKGIISLPLEEREAGLHTGIQDLLDEGIFTPEQIVKRFGSETPEYTPEVENTVNSLIRRNDTNKDFLDRLQARKIAETPEEKSARIRTEKQTELKSRLPDILTVKKGKSISEKDVEKGQSIISFSSRKTDGIRRAKTALNEMSKIKAIGAIFNASDPRIAAISSELRSLQLLEKGPEGADLGVLAGPDLDILNAITGSPEKLKLIWEGPEVAINKLNRLEERLFNDTNSKLKSKNFNPVKATALKDFIVSDKEVAQKQATEKQRLIDKFKLGK